MSNPVTGWIRSNMENYGEREASMIDRVSESSINAQKMCEEKSGAIKGNYWWQRVDQARDFNHLYLSQSAFKGHDMGAVNSFKAHRYYLDEAAQRRDDLLAEIAAEAAGGGVVEGGMVGGG
eukprot:CAMPEP_0198263506 /NCGR_PEP_ID=MMETSP1447-20131203/12223_1 /TAXON_ID=420782 /ORGANISM="Chaetoceros dichaeta, Strain CCMP1751" /LENGTH=120 /DNA_ID=CAMNT_0043952117 /DNA_START=122 /DNA_END=480 /DNA_ORIENTATION=-